MDLRNGMCQQSWKPKCVSQGFSTTMNELKSTAKSQAAWQALLVSWNDFVAPQTNSTFCAVFPEGLPFTLLAVCSVPPLR